MRTLIGLFPVGPAVVAASMLSVLATHNASAVPTLSTDNGTTIGTMTSPNYGSGYSGFWRSNSVDYALLTDGIDTFLNAPTGSGTIYFRQHNLTRMSLGTAGLDVPTTITVGGYINSGGPIFSHDGLSVILPATGGNFQNPTATIWGEHKFAGSTSYGVKGIGLTAGVRGESTGGNGVEGSSWGGGSGVYGKSTTSNGVLGITEATGLSAAAISAVAPNTSSLAYWGNGGIIITGDLAQKAGGGSWSMGSDARIKRDVKEFHEGLREVLRVKPINFKYNGLGGTADDGKEYVGVIAQELEKIAPSMVSSKKAKLHKNDADETDIKYVDPSAFTYMLINAVQEQERRIVKLEAERPTLKSSLFSGDLGQGVLIGLTPLGLAAALRRRRKEQAIE